MLTILDHGFPRVQVTDLDDVDLKDRVVTNRYDMERRSKGPQYRVYLTNLSVRYNMRLIVKLITDRGNFFLFVWSSSLRAWPPSILLRKLYFVAIV